MRGDGRLTAAAIVAAVWMAGAAGAATIEVSSATLAPGASAEITVSLLGGGATIIGTQNRLDFTRQAFVAPNDDGDPDCAVEPSINKPATGFRYLPLGCDPNVDCTSVRVFVLSIVDLDPIPDGPLYTCRVAAAADAAEATYPLANSELRAAGPGGSVVDVSGSPGAVTVAVVQLPVARLVIGQAGGMAGDARVFAVSLELLDDAPGVAGVQLDIGFHPETQIPPTLGGGPACEVNPALDKADSSFVYLPSGCTAGVNCSAVRAIVLSLTNTDAIIDGSQLFACSLALGLGADPGVYPLIATNPLASAPDGDAVPVLASDGAVEVTQRLPACAGDCDGNRTVSISELLLGVNIVIGSEDISACPAFDTAGDGDVTVSELIQAVNAALSGCPTSA